MSITVGWALPTLRNDQLFELFWGVPTLQKTTQTTDLILVREGGLCLCSRDLQSLWLVTLACYFGLLLTIR